MLVRFLLTALLATGIAAAQAGRSGDENGSLGRVVGHGGGGPARSVGKREMLMDKLKLSKEQKEEAEKILIAAAEKTAPEREALTKARIAVANAITGKASDAELKTLLDECTAVNAKMTSIEAESFGKLYALLKPNQQAKAPQAFELMAGMFSSAAPANAAGGGKR